MVVDTHTRDSRASKIIVSFHQEEPNPTEEQLKELEAEVLLAEGISGTRFQKLLKILDEGGKI